MSNALVFTVFTPTFNRANTLHRVYESLCKQTFRSFEWLIVDDGSVDNTRELVEQWQSDSATWFPIRYIWQSNQHKKVAHNRAVMEAKGELFSVLDSDDQCTPEALEQLHLHWITIPQESRKEFAGVGCLCSYENGEVVGDQYPCTKYIDSNSLELFYLYRVRGEKWGTIRVDILKKHLFPEHIPGLVPEGVIWSKIAEEYKVRFVNKALRIYHLDEDGLVARKGKRFDASQNALGAAYHKKSILSDELGWFLYAPVWFYLEAARFSRFYYYTEKNNRALIGCWPRGLLARTLIIAALPVSMIMILRDCLRNKG